MSKINVETVVIPAQTFHSYDVETEKKQLTRKRRRLPRSEIYRRRGRLVGSDDIRSVIMVLKFGDEAGLSGKLVQLASDIAQGLDEASRLILQEGNHFNGSKKARSCRAILKNNKSIKNLKVTCRDNKERSVMEVVTWYSNVHFRVAKDIWNAEQREARLAAQKLRAIEVSEQIKTFEDNLKVA